jgi:ATP-dependent helicase/DNAse subunit B
MSATSLRLLLRDPIRFVWRYGLGWREPQLADDPITLDALAFGNLAHEVLQTAVTAMEADGGFGKSRSDDIERAVRDAISTVASGWEANYPVPPRLIWKRTLQEVERLSAKALAYRFDPLPGQKSWTEVPFGAPDAKVRDDLPWDVSRPVEIPNTGVVIRGQIDRLDVAGDLSRARVFDYKTGRFSKKMADVVVDGGGELQRCLYALAVRTLIGNDIHVEASLLYLRAADGAEGLFPLRDVDAALNLIAGAVATARANLEKGLALPGIDAGHAYNDLAFALPADPSYLPRKQPLAEAQMGDAIKIWAEP